MEDVLIPIFAVGILFLGLPWLLFHYVTQWKKTGTLSLEDENLLDELHDLARRLDDRMTTIERIVAADSPDFRLRVAARDEEERDGRSAFHRPLDRDPQPRSPRSL
ncbi:envelope stress response membrane protein PspB [uncultured Sphingomonas sp.]|uniref:envelope stress response membrane protein PspB n=1 Tax=uncultured Sphingomonas sp. TaxID=158754 RepID=UPI0025DBC070|nr:envelope stress response membrane protein PspB [uncultured Sphingomonas sp.]